MDSTSRHVCPAFRALTRSVVRAAWRRLGPILTAVCMLPCCVAAQANPTNFIEEMTWPEISQAIAAGKTTALYYAGSTEQNGPHMVTGKHSLVARYVVDHIATNLGNALVYPVMPFAPTGDPLRKTEHMAYPGSVSVDEETFGAVARQLALSAVAAGFKCVVLMGDHGGGQAALSRVAESLTAGMGKPDVRIIYVPDVYERSNQMATDLLQRLGLPFGDHASIIDTSELLFVSPHSVRKSLLTSASPQNGSSGFAKYANAALGEQFIGFKVRTAVEKIRQPSACGS